MKQKGFAPILIVLIFSALFVVAGTGYWYSSEIKKAAQEIVNQEQTVTKEEQNQSEQNPPEEVKKEAQENKPEEKAAEEEVRDYYGVGNVHYYKSRSSPGILFSEPDIRMAERYSLFADGSITLKGSIEDTHLLSSYPATIRVMYIEGGGQEAKNYILQVSKDGQFEKTVPFEFGLGMYEITFFVPKNVNSVDDIDRAKLISFRLINRTNEESEKDQKSAEQPKVEEIKDTVRTIPNLDNYTLVDYSVIKSPVYNQFTEKCDDPYWADSRDTRLVKNGTEILIPSLIEKISAVENRRPSCAMRLGIFSFPPDGKYLYLSLGFIIGSDAPYSGLSGLYRVNLSTAELVKLSVNQILASTDLYRGSAIYSYTFLSDGKRLIKWNMGGVYLINLEQDSYETIFTPKEGQWLISKIVFNLGQEANYDVSVNGNQVIAGLYDKTQTADGAKMEIDKYYNVKVEGADWAADVSPRFIEKVTIPIP